MAFNIGNGFNAIVNDVDFDSLGNIYSVGDFTTFDFSTSNRALKQHPDGKKDTAFNIGSGFNDDPIRVVVDEPRNRVYIAGSFTTFTGSTNRCLIALNMVTGARDYSFHIGQGFQGDPFSLGQPTVNDIAIDANGKIYAVGSFNTLDGVSVNPIVRINTDGSLDTSFTTGTMNGEPRRVALDSIGKVYMYGLATIYRGVFQGPVFRMNTAGAVDATFVPASITSFRNPRDLVIDVSDNVYISYGVSSSSARIRKLDTSGNVDSSFVSYAFDTPSDVHSLLHNGSGRLYAGGAFVQYNGVGNNNRIIKLSSGNGAKETAFINIDGANSTVWSVKRAATGHILLAGNFTSYYGSTSWKRMVLVDPDTGAPVSGAVIAISNLDCDTISSSTINLTWNQTGGVTGDTVTISRSTNGVSYSTIGTVNGTVTSYSDTGLTASAVYYYRVAANSVTLNTFCKNYTISSLSCSGSSVNSIDLEWSVSGSDIALTRTIVERGTDGVSYSTIADLTGATSYTSSGLSQGVQYYYRIYTYNFSDSTLLTTSCSTLKSTIDDFICFPTDVGTELNLEWTVDSPSFSNNIKLEISNDGLTYNPFATLSGVDESFTATGLTEGTHYYFKIYIQAFPLEAQYTDCTTLKTVISDFYCSPEWYTMTLNWSFSDIIPSNTLTLQQSTDGVNFTSIAELTVDDTSFFATGLTPNTGYVFKIYVNGFEDEFLLTYCTTLFTASTCNEFNLVGIRRLWIAIQPPELEYTVVDSTYTTYDYNGNDIATIFQFNQFVDFKALGDRVSNVSYEQTLDIGNEGYVFNETLEMTVGGISNSKWNDVTTLVNNPLVIVFEDNNGTYCVMGYDDPAQLLNYRDDASDDTYNLTFTVQSNYYLVKFINPGVLPNDFTSTKFNNPASALAEFTGNSFYVGGAFSAYDKVLEARILLLNPDMSKNSYFEKEAGFNNKQFGTFVKAICPYTGNTIICGGGFEKYDNQQLFNIVRLTTDGVYDDTFNTGVGFGGGFNNYVGAIDYNTTTGRIYVGGYFATLQGVSSQAIAALTPTGLRDSGFNVGTGAGYATPGEGNGLVNSVVVDQSSGKVYIGGSFYYYNGTVRNSVARINTDGSLDNTFTSPFISGTSVNSLVLDGSDLYVASFSYASSGGSIVRLDNSGAIDPTYNVTGLTAMPGRNFNIYAITMDSSSRIVATGEGGIYRFNTDGSTDHTFNTAGKFEGVAGLGVKVLSDGSIVVAGNFWKYDGHQSNCIVRIDDTGGYLA